MDGTAQNTEVQTAQQPQLRGVGRTTPTEATPQQSYSPEAPTQNAAASVPGTETYQPQPTQVNAEGYTTQTPDIQPAISSPPPAEQPTTNNSSEGYAQVPTQTPETLNQAQVDPSIAQAEAELSLPHGEIQKNNDPSMTVGAGEAAANYGVDNSNTAVGENVASGIDSNAQYSAESPTQNSSATSESVPNSGSLATENMASQLGETVSIDVVNTRAQEGLSQVKGTELEEAFLNGYSQGVAISLVSKKS